MTDGVQTLRILVPCLLLYTNLVFGTEDEFSKLYDYYFPKHGAGLRTFYRESFDKALSAPPPTRETERHPDFYFAFQGSPEAFHEFVHNPDRDAEGEFSETWTYECVVLLLKLGDEQFSELLAKEDARTREIVGESLDSQIDWDKHDFPKTRALYSYRYAKPTREELEQRRREPIAVAWKGVTQDQRKRIEEALVKDKRFSDVQLTSTQEGITSITVPRSMPSRDKTDLERLVRHELKNTQGVQYYP